MYENYTTLALLCYSTRDRRQNTVSPVYLWVRNSWYYWFTRKVIIPSEWVLSNTLQLSRWCPEHVLLVLSSNMLFQVVKTFKTSPANRTAHIKGRHDSVKKFAQCFFPAWTTTINPPVYCSVTQPAFVVRQHDAWQEEVLCQQTICARVLPKTLGL